jgi:thioredoxin reductase/ferredoxin
LNLAIVLGCFALLLVVLVVLGHWQQKITASQKERVLEEIREAESLGTHKPLAQHPQIDVQACIGCGSCVAACPEEGVLGLVDGVARVIHGARCIGHARCAVACPVAALQVGLGELATSPNLPVLTARQETTLRGVYVAGELGGFSLIRVATQQGSRVIEQIAAELGAAPARALKNGVDVLIAGAGPAGLSAALKATELGLRYLVVDQDDIGGTVRKYPRRKLTLTGPMELPLYGPIHRDEFVKEELIALWEKIIAQHRLKIRTKTRLESVEPQADGYIVRTSAGALPARRIVLALGRQGTPRKLGAPGEAAEKVLYQLMDAASYTGMNLLVVGGGDSAVEAATALASQPGNVVTLSYRKPAFFRLKSRNQERIQRFASEGKVQVLFNSAVQRIDRDSVTLQVSEGGVDSTRALANDFTFVLIGGEPPYALLRGMGVRFHGDVAESGAESPVLAEAEA